MKNKAPKENQKYIDLFAEMLEYQGAATCRTMLTEVYMNYSRSLIQLADECLLDDAETQLYYLQQLIRVLDPETKYPQYPSTTPYVQEGMSNQKGQQ